MLSVFNALVVNHEDIPSLPPRDLDVHDLELHYDPAGPHLG